MRLLGLLIFKITGWKAINNLPHLKRYVAIAAPHTSNWDALYGLCAIGIFGINFRYLIKKDLFFFPLKYFLRSTGGLPVDRTSKNSLTDQVASFFSSDENIIIGVTPEGTRSANANWKKGFYYIAQKAKVPIVLGYIDYAKKEAVIDRVFEPTGDVEQDLLTIKDYYKDKTAYDAAKFTF